MGHTKRLYESFLMDRNQFDDLVSRNFNRIPFLREISADLDTPLSIYLKVASEPNTYLFESMQGGEKLSLIHI